jgi:hypothetical protein
MSCIRSFQHKLPNICNICTGLGWPGVGVALLTLGRPRAFQQVLFADAIRKRRLKWR